MWPCDNDIARFASRILLLTVSLSVGSLLSSCSSLPEQNPISRPDLQAVLGGDALVEAGVITAYEPPEDTLMTLNDDMRAFLHHYVPARGSDESKLDALLYALLHRGILGLAYDPAASHTASGAFEDQSANCLGFSLLFVSMAREIGLQARFNDVAIPPVWDFQGTQSYILFKHMNSVVRLPAGKKKVVDINRDQYKHHYRQRLLTDNQAKAHYFNNQGVNFMLNGNLSEAFNYFRKGLDIAPESSFVWSSLGTLYRRAGLLRESELAYLQGLSQDSKSTVVLNNLGYLYGAMGNQDLANFYRKKVETARKSNPHYRYAVAKNAFVKKNLSKAHREITIALERESNEHTFWYLAARISAGLSRNREAEQYLQKAMDLVKDTDVLVLYQETKTQWQASL